jgi:hypothetical protein
MSLTNTTEIEKRLWDAADELRANSKLKSLEYSVPVLGLIFLRYRERICQLQHGFFLLEWQFPISTSAIFTFWALKVENLHPHLGVYPPKGNYEGMQICVPV